MSLTYGLNDALLFEVPDRAAAEQLSTRLRQRTWIEWVEERDGEWFVSALLRPSRGDLAILLREVEAWASERGLDELWFLLDRRSYLLKVGDSELASAAG